MSDLVVDTSALIAILKQEQAAPRLIAALLASGGVHVPAPVLIEAKIVAMARAGASGQADVDALVVALGGQVASFGPVAAALAADGLARFGRGRHSAALNFGDCLVYGTARALDLPLLFVGNDFAQTDLAVAPY